MREVEQSAYLLHSRPYKEHQVIAEFLTQDLGKVAAVTYASSSAKQSKKALLQPFIPLKLSLKGKGNLKSATQIEAAGKSFSLVGNHLFSALYLNELQCKLLGELVPVNSLFAFYGSAIAQLAEQQPIEPILREFESRLLDELGYSLDFTQLNALNTQYCQFIPDKGFLPVSAEFKGQSYNLSDLKAIAAAQVLTPEQLQTYKVLMRHVINFLLDGRPLNSRKLFTK